MKKLIALISAIAVMGTMSLTSLAAIEVTPNAEATGATLAKNATSGYDASYASDKVNTQTTILAVKGAEITTTSIQYINQLAQDSETAINFDLKDALAVGDVVNVYMGGDAIDKTLVGTITSAADKYTVTFYDANGVDVLGTLSKVESGYALAANAPAVPPKDGFTFKGWATAKDSADVVTLPETVTADASYYAVWEEKASAPETITISGTVSGYAGSTLPTVVVTDGTTDYPAIVAEDGTFSVDVPVLTEGSYELKANKTSHLGYTKTMITTATVINPVVKAGDIDGSNQADVLDIAEIINVFNSKTGDSNYNIVNDLDESGQCDVLDISEVINNFNEKSISE